MKKILLFGAAALLSLGANAQGFWTPIAEGDVAEEKIEETTNPGTTKAKVGELTEIAQTEIENATIYLFDGGGDWTVKSISEETYTIDEFTFNKSYIQGATNGMKGSIDKDGTTSAHLQITPAIKGTFYIAAKFGKNKPIWAAKVPEAEVEDLDYANLNDYLIEPYSDTLTVTGGRGLIYIKDDGTGVQSEEATADVHTALPLNVEPGNTYFFWVSGSKIMLEGLAFKADATPISAIGFDAEDEIEAIYNLAGAKINELSKGVNFVKYTNGKVVKVMK